MKKMKKKIDSIIKEKEEEMMILGGDFNARIGTMGEVYMGEETENTNRRKSKDKVVNTIFLTHLLRSCKQELSHRIS